MRYLAILLLAGCATQGEPPKSGYLFTEVRFTAWGQVDQECRKLGTQARTSIYGCASLEPPHFVIVPQPASMTDDKALCVLGHEIGHNLGGRH